MGDLFRSEKKTTQSVSNTTNTQKQVGAGDGGFAVGADSNVTIQNLDASLARDAINEIGDVSGESIRNVTTTAAKSIDAQTRIGESSLIAQNQLARDALGEQTKTSVGALSEAFGFVKELGQQQLSTTRQTGELIAAQAGVVPPASFEGLQKTSTKTIMLIGIIAVSLYAISILRKK